VSLAPGPTRHPPSDVARPDLVRPDVVRPDLVDPDLAEPTHLARIGQVGDRLRADEAPPAATAGRPVRSRISVVLVVLDTLLLGIAFVLAHVVRFPWEMATIRPAGGLLEFTVAPVVVVLWSALLGVAHSRDPRVVAFGDEEYRRVLTASLVAGAVVAVVAYAAGVDLARGYVAIAFPVGLALLVCGRKAVRTVVARRRGRGVGLVDVLVVGEAADVRYVGHRLVATPAAGYRVVGVLTDCLPHGSAVGLGGRGVPVLGGTADVLDVARSAGVGAVLLAGAVPGGHERVRRLGWQLEADGVELVVSSPLTDIAPARVHERSVDGLPLMHVGMPDYCRRRGKRTFDVVGAGVGLVLLAPVFGMVALAIRFDDGGPVLFRQTRVGRGGTPFSICKFRTMCVDAEQRLASLGSRHDGAGPLFKLHDDPRVTRVGRFLRRTSLDELPQLWNVLVGTMSLVGPRPALPSEVERYQDFDDRRLLVTPGITGLWQVSGRSDLDWSAGVRLDQYYVENWSFLHDIVILARTVPSVLRSRGAY
jgi:exopolysaccharide biosynthesis polyprenyl glycosylphosphotransferase